MGAGGYGFGTAAQRIARLERIIETLLARQNATAVPGIGVPAPMLGAHNRVNHLDGVIPSGSDERLALGSLGFTPTSEQWTFVSPGAIFNMFDQNGGMPVAWTEDGAKAVGAVIAAANPSDAANAYGMGTLWFNNSTSVLWVKVASGTSVTAWMAIPTLLYRSGILTISAGGNIAPTASGLHIVAANSGVADQLDTITGAYIGQLIWLIADTGDTITVKYSAFNGLLLQAGLDVDLTGQLILGPLIHVGGNTWYDLSRVIGHAHSSASTGSQLYSICHYVNVPDAAFGAAVTAGDGQGAILHSGASGFTATKLFVDAETAPGASGLPITWQYGDTDDLDTVASWTTIATLTLSSEKSANTTSMTNAAVPANRVLRMNVGTIVGSPKDVTSMLFGKVAVST